MPLTGKRRPKPYHSGSRLATPSVRGSVGGTRVCHRQGSAAAPEPLQPATAPYRMCDGTCSLIQPRFRGLVARRSSCFAPEAV